MTAAEAGCGICRHWREEAPPPEGRCHRFPPAGGQTWPLVLAGERCGEFAPQPEEKATGMRSLSAAGIRRAVVDAVNGVLGDLDADDPLTLEKDFAADLGADSLYVAEIVMEVEDEFDLDFTADGEAALVTVGDLVRETQRLVREKGGAG